MIELQKLFLKKFEKREKKSCMDKNYRKSILKCDIIKDTYKALLRHPSSEKMRNIFITRRMNIKYIFQTNESVSLSFIYKKKKLRII